MMALDTREEEGGVDDRHAPVEQPQFPDVAVVLGPLGARVEGLERPRAIDHARQAAGEHVEQRADPREHEHRAERQLDRLRDGRYGRKDGHDAAP